MSIPLESRITTTSTTGSFRDLPSVTFFVDNMAISRATIFEEHFNEPDHCLVKDMQSGRTFPVMGRIHAERVALQIAKAYLFDVVALFGTDKLPE
jgi:hypothetical protein